MGKVLLILVVLITVIFAAITLTVQKKSTEVPETVAEKLEELQAKDLGAFSLNYAIKQVQDGVVTTSNVPFSTDDPAYFAFPVSGYSIMDGAGTIDSILYSYIDTDGIKDTLQIRTKVTYGSSPNIITHRSETILASIIKPFPSEVGDWSMDEGSGDTTEDGNDNGNDGDLVNIDTTTVWVNGQHGSAIHIDGWNDRVDLGTGVSSTYDDVLTVACWAKMDPSFLDWGVLVAEQTNQSGWPVCWSLRARVFDIWFFKTVKYAFNIVTSEGSGGVQEVKIEKNNWQMNIYDWHFIIGSYDGTYSATQAEITVQIYDEGYIATKIVSKWSRRDSTNTVSIGGRETNVPWFGAFTCIDATLDEVKMFDEILSGADLQKLYLHNGDPSAGIIYWKE